MGEVFKAWDPRLERDVAIKLLHPESAADPDRQRRLRGRPRRERAESSQHPPRLRRRRRWHLYYLVSEWLEGKSLRDELSRGALPLKRLLDLAVQIADGLAAAHATGIVHRDIKPENVMLARDGTARIVDFGLARSSRICREAGVDGHASTVTPPRWRLSGTPAYMSPEQARGTAGDFRTDQFSFGALIYEMATGQVRLPPRHADRHVGGGPPRRAETDWRAQPANPGGGRWIVEQCLAKDAPDRYAATEDLARELRRVRERLREHAGGEGRSTRRTAFPMWHAVVGVGGGGRLPAIGVVYLVPAAEPLLRFMPLASAAAYEGTPAGRPTDRAWS